MRKHDEQMKKASADLGSIKSQLAKFKSKDGGNLMTRDFTDDIYSDHNIKSHYFVEEIGSTMFCNIVVVLAAGKVDTFDVDMHQHVRDYYESADAMEAKRIPMLAVQKYNDLKEKANEFESWCKDNEIDLY